MVLETRRNGNLYYYKKRREGNRVISEYIGSGLVASLAQKRAEIERRQKQMERERLQAERMSAAEIDKAIDGFSRLVDSLMEAELLLSGYHKHKRQ
jgi:hypothetical protein